MLDQQEAPSRTELSKGVHNFNSFHQDGMRILFFVQIKLHFFFLNMRCHLSFFLCQCRSGNFYIGVFYLPINNFLAMKLFRWIDHLSPESTMIPSDTLVLDKNRNIKNAFLIIILVICLQCQMGHYWFPKLYYISPGRRRNLKSWILFGSYLTW